MPATVTLSTTTLTYGVGSGEGEVTLASTSGIYPGYRLWIDRELMKVKSVSGNVVQVSRGTSGTADVLHSSTALVTFGTPDQFFFTDPVGAPSVSISVSPHINTHSGKVWMAQGDTFDGGYRYWVEVTNTYGVGPLGIRTQTSAPTSST